MPKPARESLPPIAWVSLLLLGFASGLPLFLTGSTLKAWLTTEGLNLKTIGAFSLVTLPYSLKVFWAPLVDRYAPPGLGRRRGWLLVTQLAMALTLAAMAIRDPKVGLQAVAWLAIMVAVASATFDIAVDAWRAEVLPQAELGLGNSIHIAAYRVAMLVSGGGAMVLASRIGWRGTYLTMALLTLLGILGTLLAPSTDERAKAPRTLQAAVIGPLRDLLARPGIAQLAVFAMLYKLGDWLAEAMTMPFLLRGVGFTLAQVGTIQKTTAMAAIILGGLLGGLILTRVSLRKCLIAFGFVQMLSILGFWLISRLGPNLWLLVGANGLENLAYGLGGSAFAVLLMGSCNRAYTGTQFALFTSIMSLPRTVFAGGTGWLVEGYQQLWGIHLGWSVYFLACAASAVPGLLLLTRYRAWGLPEDEPGSSATL